MKRTRPEPKPRADDDVGGEYHDPPAGCEVPALLPVHPLYRLLKLREIPGFQLGADWRFRRVDIDAWIAAQEIRVIAEEEYRPVTKA